MLERQLSQIHENKADLLQQKIARIKAELKDQAAETAAAEVSN